MFKDIYIETENLIIKPYSMDDLEDLYKVYSDEKVIEKIGMKFKSALKVDDPNYSGYDGELYYAITKEEWSS